MKLKSGTGRAIAIMLLCVIPPALASHSQADVASQSLVFWSTGSGHAMLTLAEDVNVTLADLLVPPEDPFVAIFLSGPSSFFYGRNTFSEAPAGGVQIPHPLEAGTYHAYVIAPPSMDITFELTLDAPGPSAEVLMTPTWGATFPLTGPTPSVLVGTPPSSLGSPVALDRGSIALPERGLLVTLDHFAIYGPGATTFSTKHHVAGDVLRNDCTLTISAAFTTELAGLQATALGFFVEDPGTWQLGVDYYDVGTWLTLYHHSFGLAFVLDEDDTYENPFWPNVFAAGPFGAVPPEARDLAVTAACTSTPPLPP